MRSEKQLFQKIDKILLENAEIYTFVVSGRWGGYTADFLRSATSKVITDNPSKVYEVLGHGEGATRREAIEEMLEELEANFKLTGDNFAITK